MAAVQYATFAQFYPYYLAQHGNRLCRRAHFLGTTSAVAAVAQALYAAQPGWLLVALASGYGGAWIGHFAFEKNRPATFGHPCYAFCADWVMYWQMLTGKLSW
jgi:hypothetical protein